MSKTGMIIKIIFTDSRKYFNLHHHTHHKKKLISCFKALKAPNPMSHTNIGLLTLLCLFV